MVAPSQDARRRRHRFLRAGGIGVDDVDIRILVNVGAAGRVGPGVAEIELRMGGPAGIGMTDPDAAAVNTGGNGLEVDIVKVPGLAAGAVRTRCIPGESVELKIGVLQIRGDGLELAALSENVGDIEEVTLEIAAGAFVSALV